VHHYEAANRSTDQFIQSTLDPRIYYEPGREEMARVAAGSVSEAVETVERRQFRRLSIPVRVYLCATIESFKSYGASPRAGGHTINHRVFISPKPENTPERMPRLLAHELSHLQLGQSLGLVRGASTPPWFAEGLATYVSGGGGAEDVTDEEAQKSILQGHAFVPDDGGVFSRKFGSAYGLGEHLFYREASLFFGFLEAQDSAKFRALLLAVEDGASISVAMKQAYDVETDIEWQRFIESIKQH
jgi:hypothetical protein